MITYDDQGRAYFNGERVARTTEVCAILAPRTWNADDYYLHKGLLIHRITEWEDTGDLDESSVDPILTGYLSGYRRFKADTGFKSTITELPFYSQRHGYCGRVDKYGPLFNYLSVIDVKSGQPHEADQYQAPAYLFGLKENGFPCWRAWDLYLKANGSYKLAEVKQLSFLFQKFLGGLKKFKEENNGAL